MMKINYIAILLITFLLAIANASPSQAGCCLDPDKLEELVLKFSPVIVQEKIIPAEPTDILYRAATDDDCRFLYLAYHVIWPYEQDPRPGFWPTVTRMTYTGGLKLQRLIYGPGDVEVIEFTVDLETEKIVRITYETAEYDKKGSVIHVDVAVEENDVPDYLPMVFKSVSWNHMFDMLEGPGQHEGLTYKFKPKPFTDELWDQYRMSKKKSNPFGLDRAHHPWETRERCGG